MKNRSLIFVSANLISQDLIESERFKLELFRRCHEIFPKAVRVKVSSVDTGFAYTFLITICIASWLTDTPKNKITNSLKGLIEIMFAEYFCTGYSCTSLLEVLLDE
jgi:hypothetical protein